MHRVIEHRRQRGFLFRRSLHEIVSDDDDDHTGRAHVLLRARIDQRVTADINRPAEHV